jgi:GxxExxY protein
VPFAIVGVMLIRPNEITAKTISCAIEVHRSLGPGLLESAYEACLFREFVLRGMSVERQVPIPVLYKDKAVDCAYRADFIVEHVLLVEIKSVTAIDHVHESQVLTYMKLLNLNEALLMNFNRTTLKDGIRRFLR